MSNELTLEEKTTGAEMSARDALNAKVAEQAKDIAGLRKILSEMVALAEVDLATRRITLTPSRNIILADARKAVQS